MRTPSVSRRHFAAAGGGHLPARRVYAGRTYRDYADQIERLGATSGLGFSPEQLRAAAAAARQTAREFGTRDDPYGPPDGIG